MAPDTEQEVIKINLKIVGGLLGIAVIFIAGIAWSVRLESRVDETARTATKHDAQIIDMQKQRSDDHDRSTRMEVLLETVLTRVDEIRKTLKP